MRLKKSNLLMNDVEASDFVRMPAQRLCRLAKSGEIPHVVLPDNEIRFFESELRDWVQNHHMPARSGGEQ